MLNTQAHMASYDDFYEALLTAHQGLSTAQSHALNARLVLLLSNHIGDMAVLKDALRLARAGEGLPEDKAGTDPVAVSPVAPAHAARDRAV